MWIGKKYGNYELQFKNSQKKKNSVIFLQTFFVLIKKKIFSTGIKEFS